MGPRTLRTAMCAIVLLASCGQGASTDAAAARDALTVESCALGGDDYTSVTIYVSTDAAEAAYEVKADVRLLHRKGGAPEIHRVSFAVEPDMTRVYVQPGMEKGSTQYKGCKVEVIQVTTI